MFYNYLPNLIKSFTRKISKYFSAYRNLQFDIQKSNELNSKHLEEVLTGMPHEDFVTNEKTRIFCSKEINAHAH